MVNFFLKRPVFAWVLAIAVMITGVLALQTLPIQRYPTVAPPAVSVEATYPGASADTVSNTVVQVIEQQMTGVEGLIYMSSTASSSGRAEITLTFEAGTDPDMAQVQVQNKLKQAEPLLPTAVQRQGVEVTKANTSFLMVTSFISADGRLDKQDLADFIASEVEEPIGRVKGVGNTQVFGSQYAMRIWLDPSALTEHQLTVGDIRSALEAQNTVVTAGELGGLPAVEGQQLNATVSARGLLEDPEAFRDILLKTDAEGGQVRLEDVARVELGGETSAIQTFYNQRPAAGLGINLAPGANSLATAERVKERLAELEPYFPEGVEVRYPYSTAPFVEASIDQVGHTLVEAIILVVLVMVLFLQSWRATLIPTLAIPVVLLGTFAVMAATGFSINMLTMFGMVLAIGLLVDDAIVVVENVERIMEEEGVGPFEATRRSMRQITGALVGIGVVLSAVFVPMAFFPGSTGAIYRQFSITIVTAMALSVLVALILSPTLCAKMLRAQQGEGRVRRLLFGWFNRLLEAATRGYVAAVGHITRRWLPYTIAFVALVGVLVALFGRLPQAFLPEEDQGVLVTQFQLPPGATQQRTLDTIDKVEEYFLSKEAVDGVFAVAGFSFTGRAQNVGIAFVNLKPWDERQGRAQSAQALIGKANRDLAGMIRDGRVVAFNLPPIPALGNATGFDLYLQDRGGLGHEGLMKAQGQFLQMAAQSPVLARVRPNGLADNPRYDLEIDEAKARALEVPLPAVNQLLSVAWGSGYINDFLHEGRLKRVYMQGQAPHRMLPQDFRDWYVRNEQGEMVPLNELTEGEWTFGSPRLERFNGVPARNIRGEPAPGYSTGEAMAEVERIIEQLPEGIDHAWGGISYQEQQSGSQAPLLYALSLIVVFLALAALYESWTIPFAVILAVPLGVLGAVAAALLRELPNNIFFQVGILTTLGLTAKNAILIVEFARDLEQQGRSLIEATLEAVRIRLRPILMTSLAFSMGVVPLAFSSGAGAGSQVAIGTAVLGGMVSATFLAIFFIPLFYVLIRRLSDWLSGRSRRASS